MKHGTLRLGTGLLLFLGFLSGPGAQEQKQEQKPVDLELREEVRVRFTIVDVVVIDREGRTVPGLTAGDFEVTAGGKDVPVASVDVACPGGGAGDPKAAYRTDAPELGAAPPGDRRIVLVLDYLHLAQLQRTEVLERAKEMVRESLTAGDDIMVAALTGGLRVEQPFSKERERTLRTLHRMEYDITLWNGNFSHQSEVGLLEGLSALFDVLGTVSGPKAVVLFSGMRDVPLDNQFRQIAALAAGSRCSIYPVDARGLVVPGPGVGASGSDSGAG